MTDPSGLELLISAVLRHSVAQAALSAVSTVANKNLAVRPGALRANRLLRWIPDTLASPHDLDARARPRILSWSHPSGPQKPPRYRGAQVTRRTPRYAGD